MVRMRNEGLFATAGKLVDEIIKRVSLVFVQRAAIAIESGGYSG